MTHFITFAFVVTFVSAYFSVAYKYWLKKDKRHDKADAFLMTIVTFFVTLLGGLLLTALWAVTK